MELTAAEYERRRTFCESMKKMTRPEFIEIARILRRNGVSISENRNGLFFDMAKLPASVFEELLLFRDFVTQGAAELAKRDDILRDLKESGTLIQIE
jgi:hypothetical protein